MIDLAGSKTKKAGCAAATCHATNDQISIHRAPLPFPAAIARPTASLRKPRPAFEYIDPDRKRENIATTSLRLSLDAEPWRLQRRVAWINDRDGCRAARARFDAKNDLQRRRIG